MEVLMLVGVPGSGKSTYANEMAEQGWHVISSDAIRAELSNEEDQSQNSLVFDILREQVFQALSAGEDVIVDACNINRKARKSIIHVAKRVKGTEIRAMVFNVFPEVCKERNHSRARKVPEEVIDKMIAKFEVPCRWEGFNGVYCHEEAYEYEKSVDAVLRMRGFNQYNPHHNLDLYEHCMYCALILTKRNRPNLYYAGLFHDFGKQFCQTFDTKGVAHYYNHANISAYYALCYFSSIYYASLICYHMWCYDEPRWNSLKNKAKDDPVFLTDLWELHKADEDAHKPLEEVEPMA